MLVDERRAPGVPPETNDAVANGPVVIGVCVSCRSPDGGPGAGEALLATLRDALGESGEIVARPVQCLSVCKRPCTATLSRAGAYTYVFGDVDPAGEGSAELLACARTYAADPHGYLLWRERPPGLRRGIVARIPPVGWDAPDGAHPR